MCLTSCSRAVMSHLTSPAAPSSAFGGSPLPAARFRAAATASIWSVLPRRLCSRLGRTISKTLYPRPARWEAMPAPYDPTPSMPTGTEGSPIRPSRAAWPSLPVANSHVPSTLPSRSSSASTLASLCVSMPAYAGLPSSSTPSMSIPSSAFRKAGGEGRAGRDTDGAVLPCT